MKYAILKFIFKMLFKLRTKEILRLKSDVECFHINLYPDKLPAGMIFSKWESMIGLTVTSPTQILLNKGYKVEYEGTTFAVCPFSLKKHIFPDGVKLSMFGDMLKLFASYQAHSPIGRKVLVTYRKKNSTRAAIVALNECTLVSEEEYIAQGIHKLCLKKNRLGVNP